ncbi:type VI secretion system baseplate subunit TssE [Ideonella sp.]|uniref:type VI secretion system baseplate subunit TssE n=1 Tax=Ideonella sp. TaxID=1929293 RepID=UPI0035AF9166
MSANLKDRLQPALLDRLTDDNPQQRDEADDRRVMSKSQLRQAVLRDLGWLLNAVQPLGKLADAYPALAGSVLNFGLPALSGQLASKVDVSVLEKAIRQTLIRYEPRILPDTLEVHAVEANSVLDTHNVIEFEIRGHLWSQPVPLEILLRTQLDLEAGQVQVREA